MSGRVTGVSNLAHGRENGLWRSQAEMEVGERGVLSRGDVRSRRTGDGKSGGGGEDLDCGCPLFPWERVAALFRARSILPQSWKCFWMWYC